MSEISTHSEQDNLHTHSHTHSHGPGSEGHTHSHGHPDGAAHSHSHTHDPRHMKAIINRLARSIGHLEHVKHMLEDGRDCSEVLIQLAAVRSEINNAGKLLLKEHMEHCIVDAVAENDTDAISRMNEAIDMFIK